MEEPSASRTASAPVETAGAETGRVLVVDDDVQVAETLRLLLEHDGHEVFVAHDAHTGAQWVDEHDVDVVVSDIYLRGPTGLELLSRLRGAEHDVEVILISGEPSVETAQEAVRQGAFDYLVKPVSGRVVRRTVAEALRKKRSRARAGRDLDRERARLEALQEDVTRRAHELSVSRERYQQLIEGMPLVVYELDCATMRLTYLGGKLLEMVGDIPRDGAAWLEAIHESDRLRVSEYLTELMHGGAHRLPDEIRILTGDGQVRWVRGVTSAVQREPLRVSGVLVDVTEQKVIEEDRRRLERELAEAKASLERALLEQLDLGGSAPAVRIDEAGVDDAIASDFGRSPSMLRVADEARLAAEHDEPVLITGETGTGKGVLAEWIHAHGARHHGPFVAINCSALRGELLDSELFGHARGAFTSAVRDRRGLIEEASGGTLFLDEIGEMSLETQARLLKVLEDKSFRRIGETVTRRSDFRLVCATNRDLSDEVTRGRFRRDLYFRIEVLTIRLPALRERTGDLAPLARRLLASLGAPTTDLPRATVEVLERHDWPGNVRELRNALIRALLLARGGPMLPRHFPDLASRAPARSSRSVAPPPPPASEPVFVGAPAAPPSPAEREDAKIRELLRRFDGNVAKVARTLGMSRTTLYRRLKQLGISTEG